MNPVAQNILGFLMHYGVSVTDGAPGVGSGRFPYGSGENPYQHGGDFLSRIDILKKEGLSESEIAKGMGLSTTELRVRRSLEKQQRRERERAEAIRLRDEGKNPSEIARIMGYKSESSIRNLLRDGVKINNRAAQKTADFLKKRVDEDGMIDIGVGVEKQLGISEERLKQAAHILKQQGYEVYKGGIPQVTNPGRQTITRVLCPPGTPHKDIYDFDKVSPVLKKYISHDGGDTFEPRWVYPKSMDSTRLKIRYAEEGGIEKDGVIELRRNVPDLSLGESHYSQVRILVDNDRYLKGMAVYSDDMPDGVDVIFNTNKKKGTAMRDVLKPIKDDPENPFGSLIKEGVSDPDDGDNFKGGQSYYYDKSGKKQLSLINKRADEGDWGEWSDHLPAQFLSKQNLQLINQQLNLSIADKKMEYEEIHSLTNPTVRKHLLKDFADGCDSAAEHLQAAALPRQKYQVILPVPTMKDTEVYAPRYNDGEKVALIRFPHGGTFEIPILTVNNKHKDARKLVGTVPSDVVCINSKVAERLSGADFDGDTVMVIPTGGRINISSTPPLKDLEGFDPKLAYPKREGMKPMKDTQKQMGVISNLITDMTIKGANSSEIARAVRHSMVVIDAEKHELDWKRSELENGIAELRRKYQGRYDENGKYREGASTLISRAKSQKSVDKRQGQPKTNIKGEPWYDPNRPEGALVYKTSKDLTYTNKNGKVHKRTEKSTQMAETDDAYLLVSDADNVIETAYANYANTMKALANKARKEIVTTGDIAYSAEARNTYKEECKTLEAKLKVSLMNAPLERQAQRIANTAVRAKKLDNPDLSKGEIKKISQQAIVRARTAVGAKRHEIEITPREWEAIQAGAVSKSNLSKILTRADIDVVREYAQPREKRTLGEAKINKMNAMAKSGYTVAEIAKALGVSSSTVLKYLKI